MPITGRSFEIASSTSFTDFLRPTSIGMIDPGNRTEFRSGRIEMYSGTSTGPSAVVFFVAIVLIVVRTGPGCDKLKLNRRERRGGPWALSEELPSDEEHEFLRAAEAFRS